MLLDGIHSDREDMTDSPADDTPATDPEVRDDAAADTAPTDSADVPEVVEIEADADNPAENETAVHDADTETEAVDAAADDESAADAGDNDDNDIDEDDGHDGINEESESETDGSGESEAVDSEDTDEPDDPEDLEDEEETEDSGDSDDSDDSEDSDDPDDDAPDANGVTPLAVASVVEAILFAAREPLKIAQIARAVGKRTRQETVREAIDELNVQYLETARAFEIAEISGRYQLMSRPEYAEHIMRIYPKRELTDKDKSHRLTPAALDTLAIIAYKQPVMRSEIEHIRGVACGPVLKALIERGSVREVGRRADLVGKPAVFGTTERFLAEFGLGSLEELPLRNEFQSFPGMEPPVEMTLIQPEGGDDGQATETEVEPVSAAEALSTAGNGREADAPPVAAAEEPSEDEENGEETSEEEVSGNDVSVTAGAGEDGDVDILASLPNGDDDAVADADDDADDDDHADTDAEADDDANAAADDNVDVEEDVIVGADVDDADDVAEDDEESVAE